MKERIFTSLIRFILSTAFLFSSIVKAVDPFGTAYKIEEYLQYFKLDFLLVEDVPVMLAVILATFEFIIGVNFLFGIRRKFTFIMSFIFMLIVTPFTFYIFIANPVSDCGCFGDAVILSNGETFLKNIVLLLMLSWLNYDRKHFFRLISQTNQWLVSVFSLLFIIFIAFYSIRMLPIIDFRPYAIGKNIKSQMMVPDGVEKTTFETTFILEKNGKRKTFILDNYPDSTWTFVGKETKVLSGGYQPPITDFYISNEAGEDVTESLLNDTTLTFFLVSPTIENADYGSIDRINNIYDYCVDHNYKFVCLTSSNFEAIKEWCDKSGALYPFLLGDKTVLKTMIRSNPGLMLLKKSDILGKWSYNNYVEENDLPTLMRTINTPLKRKSVPLQILRILVWYAFPLSVLIFFEQLVSGVKFFRRKLIKKEK